MKKHKQPLKQAIWIAPLALSVMALSGCAQPIVVVATPTEAIAEATVEITSEATVEVEAVIEPEVTETITVIETRANTDGSPSNEPERVQFDSGETAATLTGEIDAPNRKQYMLQASAGQLMSVQIISPDGQANFSIVGVEDGQPYKRIENEDRSFSFVLPQSQDYRLSVARSSGSSFYTLIVQIDPVATATPIAPQRIQFEAGETAATRTGTLPAGGAATTYYLLQAEAGQTMEVHAIAESAPMMVAVQSPDGMIWPAQQFGFDAFGYMAILTLPEDGDYRISFTTLPDAGETRYEATFTVVYSTAQTSSTEPERVNFAPGATSASLGDSMPAGGGFKEYVIGARAGQSLVVRTGSIHAPINFTITSPTGATWPAEPLGSEAFIFARTLLLPEDGDYTVTLTTPNAAGAALYTIGFEIE